MSESKKFYPTPIQSSDKDEWIENIKGKKGCYPRREFSNSVNYGFKLTSLETELEFISVSSAYEYSTKHTVVFGAKQWFELTFEPRVYIGILDMPFKEFPKDTLVELVYYETDY